MKTPVQRHNTPNRSSQPFFQKTDQNGLVQKEQENENPFFPPLGIQAKLTVGAPNDKYEQEADRTADQVVQRLASPFGVSKSIEENKISRKPISISSLQRKCSECESEGNFVQKKSNVQKQDVSEEEEETIQQKSADGSGHASSNLESRLNGSKGGGSPLSENTRSQMEGSFGADFSQVRVHTDNSAVQMNKELGAQAFTRGSDIYFNAGKYESNSKAGQHLLAHELTHVVQQKATIRRFTEREHKNIVDDAIKQSHGSNEVELVPGYKVTTGDIASMTGDHFKSRNQIIAFLNNSTKTGKESQEEVDYVRIVKIHGKKNRAEDFSKEARDNADQRYYSLATTNKSHFPYPKEGDENLPLGELAGKWMDLQDINDLPSAVTGYRRYHIEALLTAYEEGFTGKNIGKSLAIDSSGYHYLTDSFAAGHIMTPRDTLKEYWKDRVPFFNENLKGYLSNEVANELNNKIDAYLAAGGAAGGFLFGGVGGTLVGGGLGGGIGLLITEDFIYEQVLDIVSKKINEKGGIEFGDLVSGALHDYYNQYGIIADISGNNATLYGDSNLDKQPETGANETRFYATLAVQASYDELHQAHALGKKGNSMTDILSLKQDGLYIAETLIPKPTGKVFNEDGNETTAIKWKYDSSDELLADEKFGDAIQLFASEKASEFTSIIGELELEGSMKILKPLVEDSFSKRVINPLQNAPVQTIKNVINWTPDTGGGIFGHDEDDKAMDYAAKAEEEGTLDKLTLQQKATLIKNIIEGFFSVVHRDEEETVVKLFQATDSSDRAKLYQLVEGHSWNGDFKEGWLTWDDELYNSLSGSRLKKVRSLINEG